MSGAGRIKRVLKAQPTLTGDGVANNPMLRCFFGAAILAATLLAQAETLSYWIATGPDSQLAEWALGAWSHASGNKLKFEPAPRADARILIVWASAEEGMYGEARPMQLNGHSAVEVFVRPAPLETSDPLLRDAITYLTCLHESGHALGLPHTARFADIMYSFQYGGDIREYFGRYRRRLRTRADIPKNSGLSPADIEQLQRRPLVP